MTPAQLRKEIERISKAGGIIAPGPGDVHVNRPLTNISIAFMQDQSMFVADRIFPMVPVLKQSDVFFTIPRGHFNRDEMTERAPGTESRGANYTFDTDDYRATVWALHKMIDDQSRANYDSPLAPDRTTTEFLTRKGLIRKEKLWTDSFMKTGVWTFEADGVSGAGTDRENLDFTDAAMNNVQHFSEAMSEPIEVMRVMVRSVQMRTGFKPNVLVLGPKVYDALIDHPDIIGRLDNGQTTGLAMANRQSLAQLFEVEEIVVLEAIYNSADEGATDAHKFFTEKDALLLYRPSSPGLEVPSAGYTFAWTGFIGGGDRGMRMKRMRMETHESDRVEIQMAFVHKQIAADLGLFMNGIVA